MDIWIKLSSDTPNNGRKSETALIHEILLAHVTERRNFFRNLRNNCHSFTQEQLEEVNEQAEVAVSDCEMLEKIIDKIVNSYKNEVTTSSLSIDSDGVIIKENKGDL